MYTVQCTFNSNDVRINFLLPLGQSRHSTSKQKNNLKVNTSDENIGNRNISLAILAQTILIDSYWTRVHSASTASNDVSVNQICLFGAKSIQLCCRVFGHIQRQSIKVNFYQLLNWNCIKFVNLELTFVRAYDWLSRQ